MQAIEFVALLNRLRADDTAACVQQMIDALDAVPKLAAAEARAVVLEERLKQATNRESALNATLTAEQTARRATEAKFAELAAHPDVIAEKRKRLLARQAEIAEQLKSLEGADAGNNPDKARDS